MSVDQAIRRHSAQLPYFARPVLLSLYVAVVTLPIIEAGTAYPTRKRYKEAEQLQGPVPVAMKLDA